MLSIDCEFHTLLAVSTSLCHDHAKNSQNRVRTEFLRTTGVRAGGVYRKRAAKKSRASEESSEEKGCIYMEAVNLQRDI